MEKYLTITLAIIMLQSSARAVHRDRSFAISFDYGSTSQFSAIDSIWNTSESFPAILKPVHVTFW